MQGLSVCSVADNVKLETEERSKFSHLKWLKYTRQMDESIFITDNNERLSRQLRFTAEIDKMTSIMRRTLLVDGSRPENEYVEILLKDLWLWEHRDHLPSELSGWQQQRVAIWRALVMKPFLILADEPTWNLDSKNSIEIINLFKETSKKYNQTILMITHSQIVAKSADRILRVSDWKLIDLLGNN